MKVIDPLAQSFYVDNSRGIFITSIDLFFSSKDDVLPVTVQLRSMELGLPTQKVYPFSEVVIDPKNILVSEDSSIPTKIIFPSPVYLEGLKFHSLVILSNSEQYNVWVSRLGEIDVSTLSQVESKQILVSKQPTLGGLFKSQNASTWIESPFEDLKYTLYRASFKESIGNFNFYNPELSSGNKQVSTLSPNPIQFSSKKIRVGLGTTVQDSGLTLGNTVFQSGSNAFGNYVGSAGIATGSLRIINAGIGFTPSSGILTYAGIALTSITGSGVNATANITISNGVAIAATILNGGTGYVVGDVLTVNQIGSQTLGRNLQLSVSGLRGINELVLDNVQGDFIAGAGSTIQYINNVGISTALNASIGGNVLVVSDSIRTITDGLNVKINHRNHGMHAGENIVRISNVFPDIKPIRLISDYSKDSTSDILVDNTISFETFENVGVSSTNPGYVLIGNEILAYQGVTPTSLTGVTRQIDQTLGFTYSQGTPVYKYELNGISLRRINTTHTLQDATVSNPIDFDFYTIKIDTTQDGKTSTLPFGQVDRSVGTTFPKLYANETKSTGGQFVTATQNIQYEIVKPNIQAFSVQGTSINARIRTVSGTSIGGQEFSFEDKGFKSVSLDKNNYFESPRLICSKLNEDERLVTLPGNKSLTLNITLESSSPLVSPVVDLDRASMIFVSNLINSPITNYATDNRVANLEDDPSSFVYATNNIQLEIPATSLKVLVASYVNIFSDFRVLYSVKNDPNENSIYYPFPGYSNATNQDISSRDAQSDGTSDKKVNKSAILGYETSEIEFNDYEFTVNNLPSFKYFSIKIIGSGTNQAFPPRFKDFRVIAFT
jgi:hypothetical protein